MNTLCHLKVSSPLPWLRVDNKCPLNSIDNILFRIKMLEQFVSAGSNKPMEIGSSQGPEFDTSRIPSIPPFWGETLAFNHALQITTSDCNSPAIL